MFCQWIFREQKGMTFIEVLIALIFFTAFAISIPFMTIVLQTSHDNDNRQTATYLAHSRLEEIKAKPYEVIDTGVFYDTKTVEGWNIRKAAGRLNTGGKSTWKIIR